MAKVPGQSPAARARSKKSRHLVRVLPPNPRFSARRSEGARHIPSRADQGCELAVPRTSTTAHVEPGERGDAGKGPPRRRSRDSESSPAPVALREGKELINRMPQQRGWAASLEVAAGIANSLIDSYPFRPPPTHSESVEQKTTAGVAETPHFRHWRKYRQPRLVREWRKWYRRIRSPVAYSKARTIAGLRYRQTEPQCLLRTSCGSADI